VGPSSSKHVERVREPLRLARRVEDLLGAPLRPVEEVELLEALAVAAVETHDLPRCEDAPVVGRRVVPKPGEEIVGGCIAVGRRVEEDARPGEVVVFDQLPHVGVRCSTRVRA